MNFRLNEVFHFIVTLQTAHFYKQVVFTSFNFHGMNCSRTKTFLPCSHTQKKIKYSTPIIEPKNP